MDKIILNEIKSLASEEGAIKSARFFKTGKGGYSENDIFLGLTVPLQRQIAKNYAQKTSLKEVDKLLKSKFHEARLTALLILVEKFNKADLDLKKEIVELYLSNVDYINNWDLVDLSAHKIIGQYCIEQNNYEIIYNLSEQNHLWANRISVVSNWTIIKTGKLNVIFELAEKFLSHPHDLMQKSVGWMLREMGKKDINMLYKFLDKHHQTMPRTMLRYSIEKLSKEERHKYMYPNKNS